MKKIVFTLAALMTMTLAFAEGETKTNAGEDRDKLYKKAIRHNLSYMHAVLDENQYRTYVKLLNATLTNRGLNK